MKGCIEAMEEMLKTICAGWSQSYFPWRNGFVPNESPFPNVPLNGPDRRFMAMLPIWEESLIWLALHGMA
jgi:hypothetical protein